MTEKANEGPDGERGQGPSPAFATPRQALQLGLWAAAVTLVADQVHKLWSIFGLGMKPGDRFEVTPFLDIVYVINRGISYGFFQMDHRAGQLLLSGFAFVVVTVLFVWLMRASHTRFVSVCIGLVIGGAIGNGIDRLHLGGVADFFSLHAYGFYWYVFNIADVAIVAGIVGLLYDSVVPSRNGASNQT